MIFHLDEVFHLSNKDNNVMGNTSSIQYAGKNGVMEKRILHATCEQGVLKNICWGKKETCDNPSQEGILISKNMLMMKLKYANAMTGTTFVMIAERK